MKQKLRCSFKSTAGAAPPQNDPVVKKKVHLYLFRVSRLVGASLILNLLQVSTKNVAFDAAAPAVVPAASESVDPLPSKTVSDSVSDRYGSTISESSDVSSTSACKRFDSCIVSHHAEFSLSVRQRTADPATAPSKPLSPTPAVGSATKPTPSPVAVAKPAPAPANSMLPMAVTLLIGIFIGIVLSRMIS